MNRQLLEELRKITPEEQRYLDGAKYVDKELYMEPESYVVDSRRLLESGKLISIRTHARFVHFPEHIHNYIEMVYMCSGSTTHIINGETIRLQEGELLFLNQNATQEVLPAGEDDISINFIILPAFFDHTLQMLEEDDNLIRDFILNCLKSQNEDIGYLHFRVSGILPIQNLVENLIWAFHYPQADRRSIYQITMGLLLMQLANYTQTVLVGKDNREQEQLMVVYRYVEEHYRDGELSELAKMLHYDLHWVSRMIKRLSGKTYTELVQTKRMNQAAYLLSTSQLAVCDVAAAVGYENLSYFHRLFQKTYGMSPRTYRINHRKS